MRPKARATTEKLKLNFVNVRIFCASENVIKRAKKTT